MAQNIEEHPTKASNLHTFGFQVLGPRKYISLPGGFQAERDASRADMSYPINQHFHNPT